MGGPKHLWSGDWQRESDAASARLRPQTAEPPDPGSTEAGTSSAGRRRRVRTLRLGLLAGLVLIAGAAWGLTALLGSSDHKRRAAAAASTPGTRTAPQGTVPHSVIPRHRLPPGGFRQGGNPQTIPQPIPPTGPTPTNPQGTPSPTNPQATPTPTNPQAIPSPTPPPGGSGPPQSSTANAVVGPIVSWLGMQIETITPDLVVIDTVSLGSPADRAGLEPGEQILSVAGRPLSSATGIIAAVKGLPPGRRVPLVISYGSSPSQQVDLTLGAAPTHSP